MDIKNSNQEIKDTKGENISKLSEKIEIKTKEDLENAIKLKPKTIVLTGPIAEEYIKKIKSQKKLKKGLVIGSSVLTIGGIVAGIFLAPATGGTSAAAAASYAVHNFVLQSAKTSIVMSTTEMVTIAVIIAGALGCTTGIALQLIKNYKTAEIEIKDGVKITLERKDSKKDRNKRVDSKEA